MQLKGFHSAAGTNYIQRVFVFVCQNLPEQTLRKLSNKDHIINSQRIYLCVMKKWFLRKLLMNDKNSYH